jgi:hypothetical protein
MQMSVVLFIRMACFPGEGRCLVKGAESSRLGHKKAGEHELTMGQLLQTDHILSYGLLFISAL